MSYCDILDLCLGAEVDPNDPGTVLVRETEFPEVTVKTPIENFRAFRDDIKAGKYDDI